MTTVTVATDRDVLKLAMLMRASDRYELEQCCKFAGTLDEGWTPAAYLCRAHGMARGTWFALHKGNTFLGIGGVEPFKNDDRGAIWFIGMDAADKHLISVTKAMQRFIAEHRSAYSAIGNIVPADMVRRRRWLEILGFDFEAAEAHQNGVSVVAFWSHREDGPKD